MKQPRHSIDGFVPRRSGANIGDHHQPKARRATPKAQPAAPSRRVHSVAEAAKNPRPVGVSRSELSQTLSQIDQPADKKAKKGKKTRSKLDPRRKKQLKRASIIAGIILALLVGFVIYKVFIAGSNMFRGNVLDVFQSKPLQMDANGRSNILIFGTNEDNIEGGAQHEGALLTDSIMVLSVDQKKKDAYMVSMPRDLWVDFNGVACSAGYEEKLNALYECFSEDGSKEQEGAEALGDKVAEVTGLEIQYYAHVNHTVVKEAVDAVGGITVTVESDDPRGILDRNFDWKCNYECYYVKYENGEVAKMDGEHALAFMRARNASGGYGLPGGNFDREKNQQKVIKALREKALSAGTLTNIGKVTSLIDALGNNLRTNFETSEVRTLMNLAKDIPTDKIKSISLVDEENPVVTTGDYLGRSVVQPVAGIFEYSQIHGYINRQISSDAATKEDANIVVLNGSGVAGAAQAEADELTNVGFSVSGVDNAPAGNYGAVTIYQLSEDKPSTKAKLEKYYETAVTVAEPPTYVAEDTDFVVVLGTAN